MTTPSTPTPKCDYCHDHPVATDYGACADCHAYFVEDEVTGAPSMWLEGHEVRPDSELYAVLMDEAAAISRAQREARS